MPPTPHRRLLGIAIALATMTAACGSEPQAIPEGPSLSIQVTPLSLPSVLYVCYDLAVYNGAGQEQWAAGDPLVSQQDGDLETLCSYDYGTGLDGGIEFIGTCDPNFNPNVVRLVIDGLYTLDGRLEDGTDWLPTCTADAPCDVYAHCEPDQNVLVNFDIIAMRNANQGFFDIAVTFDDIFCSAKVDCTYGADGSDPIFAIHHEGEPVQTAVLGLACTGGPSTDEVALQSVLHVNDVRIRCGDVAPALQGEATIWACEDEGPFYGFAMGETGGALQIEGFTVAREGDAYVKSPFVPSDLAPYDRGVMSVIFNDAPGQSEGAGVVIMDSSAPPMPFDAFHPALFRRVGGDWTVAQVLDTAGQPIAMPFVVTADYLVAMNGLEDVDGDGGLYLVWNLSGPPGAREASGPELLEVPEDLTECRGGIVEGRFLVAPCRRNAEVDPFGEVDGFEAVLWAVDLEDPGNSAILVPHPEVAHFRASDLDLEGLHRDGADLLIATNVRFQWSAPPNPSDWGSDSERFAVVHRCPEGQLAACAAGDDAVSSPFYSGHSALTPGMGPSKVDLLVDDFLLGTFALEPDENIVPWPAIFEVNGSSEWGFWPLFQLPGSEELTNEIEFAALFPEARVVVGKYGPEDSLDYQGNAYRSGTFVALIPEESLAPVQLHDLPQVLGAPMTRVLGRAGPQAQRRILIEIELTTSEDVPLPALVEYTFAPSFFVDGAPAIERVSLLLGGMAPLDVEGEDPEIFPLWDTGNLSREYVRVGHTQSTSHDFWTPRCGAVFGVVDQDSQGGQDVPVIVDPVLDQFFVFQETPEGVMSFELAAHPGLSASFNLDDWDSYLLLDPSGALGNHWHYGNPTLGIPPHPRPPDAPDVLLNYAIYRGSEGLDCGAGEGSCNKLYWNMAIGFDPSAPGCTLYFDATASTMDRLDGEGNLPEGAFWPWLEATVPLTGPDGGLACTQHPMGSEAYPAVVRRSSWPSYGDNQACYRYDGQSVAQHWQCVEADYWQRYREWHD